MGILFLISRDWRAPILGILFGICGQGLSLLNAPSASWPLGKKFISTLLIEEDSAPGSWVRVEGQRMRTSLHLEPNQWCLAEWEVRSRETNFGYEILSSERRLRDRNLLFKLKIHRLFECSKSALPRAAFPGPTLNSERLAAGILWGRQDAIPREWWESFNLMGISHLIVVSGSHLALAMLFFIFFAKNLLRIKITGARINLFRISGILFVGSVLSVWPAEIPLLRAIAAFGLREILGYFFPAFYRYEAGDWVCLIGFIFGVIFPEQIFTKSFLFSFSAAWALTSPSCRANEPGLWRVVLVTLFVPFVGSFWFQGISFLTVLLNLGMIPFFSLILIPLLIWRECFSWGQDFIESVCAGFISFSHLAAEFIRLYWTPENISKEMVPILLMLALFILANRLLSARQKSAALALALFSVLLPLPPSQVSRLNELRVLDVGQGDGLLLKIGSRRLLIDGGHALDQIPKLLQDGNPTIDLWVLSHFDRDHDEVLLKNAHRFSIKELWVSDTGDQRYATLKKYLGNARTQTAKDSQLSKQWGEFVLEGLLPIPSTMGEVENANSLCLLLSRMEKGPENRSVLRALALFLGDLEGRGEKRLIPLLKARLHGERLPILKIAHHGSRFSSTEELISKVQPQIAILSAGRQNTYGHPHPSIIDRLQRWNSKIMSTIVQGDLTLDLDSNLSKD